MGPFNPSDLRNQTPPPNLHRVSILFFCFGCFHWVLIRNTFLLWLSLRGNFFFKSSFFHYTSPHWFFFFLAWKDQAFLLPLPNRCLFVLWHETFRTIKIIWQIYSSMSSPSLSPVSCSLWSPVCLASRYSHRSLKESHELNLPFNTQLLAALLCLTTSAFSSQLPQGGRERKDAGVQSEVRPSEPQRVPPAPRLRGWLVPS